MRVGGSMNAGQSMTDRLRLLKSNSKYKNYENNPWSGEDCRTVQEQPTSFPTTSPFPKSTLPMKATLPMPDSRPSPPQKPPLTQKQTQKTMRSDDSPLPLPKATPMAARAM